MTEFVVNGGSAGGLAVYSWVDQIKEMIHSRNPQVKFFGLPDSGFFLNYTSNSTGDQDYALKIRTLSSVVNTETPFPN